MKVTITAILMITAITFTLAGFVMIDDTKVIHKLNFPSPLELKKGNEVKKNAVASEQDVQNSDWYSQAMKNLSDMEYNITYDENLKTYQSSNRSNNLRFIYHNDGFTAKVRDNKIPLFNINDKTILEKDKKYEMLDEWEVQLRIMNYESGMEYNLSQTSKVINQEEDETGLNSCELSISGNKAHIETDNIRIDYTNNMDGMRQDFIIKNKPEGTGKLRLNLSVETKLNMIVGADALMFKDKKGNDKMKYSSLKCWDANGVELRAYFENNYELRVTNYELRVEKNKSQIRNSKFQIVVNDEHAIYPITIDPLSETPDWTYENNQANSQVGYSVAAAGDVNGDGFGDVIVGAPYFDGGQSDEGRIYVFHGSAAGPSTFPNYVKENDTAGSNFGYSVATAGDVNGDGYSEIIVGAPNWNGTGKAYVYHGSPAGLSVTNNWQKQITQAGADFGNSVSTAGDINNDGYSDVIIGAPRSNDGQSDEGRANIYLGSSTGLSDLIHVRLEVNSVNAYLGQSVSFAGDVNGDGYSDVIVGADRFTNDQQEEGRAYIYLGSASGITNSPFWTVESNQAFAQLGNSVSTAGDVNGDGLSDVIVGAKFYENDFSNEGNVYVYYGHASSMSTTAAWTKDIDQVNAFFGYSVGTAGDVNGDGFADVIIGSIGFASGESNEGKAYVFFGSSSGLSTSSDWADQSNQITAYFGFSVATAGDVNGDGFSDIIVGAMRYDNMETDEGSAFIYYGYADGLRTLVNWTFELNQESAYFGWSVSTAGDVNGDGYSDVILGAPKYENGQSDEGAAFVFHGSATGLSLFPNWIMEGNQVGDAFGYSVSTAGDVNGDGYSDVIIGSLYYTNGQTAEGAAFLYHGSVSGLSNTENWSAENNQAYSYFGISVSTAGDVNGDGYSDVIIGAFEFQNGQTDEGAAYVYHGSATGLSNNYDWMVEGNIADAKYGLNVSEAGDVNGDGYSDVIVGSPYEASGYAYVYHGSNSGLSSVASWSKNIVSADDFGFNVSTAGDVNGDGYSDVVIGSPKFTNGQTEEGAAYVYHGSSTGLQNTYSRLLQSNQNNAEFGNSVSCAGDVNGDGYSDIIIGALLYDNENTIEGKAFVYLGSNSGVLSAEDWSAEGNLDATYFGFSVSSAGDINGDGYSDVLVGSPYFTNGQYREGKAFSYYGNRKSGLRTAVQQYEPNTLNIVPSGGFTNSNSEARLSIFGKSPFGRVKGRLVDEVKQNGSNFSGNPISKSTAYSSFGSYTDLGTTGTELLLNINGLPTANEYKWRARVQYNLVKNPYQSYGPWKYYSNFSTNPTGGFKTKIHQQNLSLTVFFEGFYNAALNAMITSDTAVVLLRNSVSPYAVIDSALSVISSNGTASISFQNAISGTPYYIIIKHRNTIETWSATPLSFSGGALNFNLTVTDASAFGNNLKQADASPVKFALYSGDVNQDGTIDLSDVIQIYNGTKNFLTGYVVIDLTGNEIVDLTDLLIAYNNSVEFVSVVKP